MKKIIIGAIAAVVLILGANAVYVGIPSWSATSKDPRNAKLVMLAHLRWGIDPSTLVLDLISIQPTASMVDVDRALLDIASAMKGRTFNKVELAYRGKAKLQMHGAYFNTLGVERNTQNPVYTIRTMPENMMDMEG
ncbi:hypothetical protein, partial [Phyllobacterium salinisoli]